MIGRTTIFSQSHRSIRLHASRPSPRESAKNLIKLLQRSDMTALDCHARLHDAHALALGEALTPLNDAMAHLDFASAIAHGQQLLTNWPLE